MLSVFLKNTTTSPFVLFSNLYQRSAFLSGRLSLISSFFTVIAFCEDVFSADANETTEKTERQNITVAIITNIFFISITNPFFLFDTYHIITHYQYRCQIIKYKKRHTGRARMSSCYNMILSTTSNMIKNAKLNAENLTIYDLILCGAYLLYSRNVIRLARDDISVPTPPILTPTNNAL